MISYTKPLKVCHSNGEIIIARIFPFGDKVKIKIKYIKEVEEDNPKFANDGRINFNCSKNNYNNVIKKLTSYLENLFLKGIGNENIHTGIGVPNVKRGNAKKNSTRTIGTTEGKGNSSSIHSSTGRKKSTEGNKGKVNDIDMDKSDNSSISREDKDGD